MEPLEPINSLISRALELWHLLLNVEHPWWEEALQNPREAAQVAVLRDGKPYARVGYLVTELFTTLGKAGETLELAKQMWPGLTTRGYLWRVNTLRRRVPRKATDLELKFANADEDYAERVWNIVQEEGDLVPFPEDQEMGSIPEILPTDYSRIFSIVREFVQTSDGAKASVVHEPESIYFALCKYRDEHALAKEAERYDVPTIDVNGGPELAHAIQNLEKQDRRELVRMVRRFRVENRLFGWLKFGDGDRTLDRYPALFDGLVEQPLDTLYVDSVVAETMSKTKELADDTFQTIRRIVERVSQAISEAQYETVVDAIQSGQNGERSVIGNPEACRILAGRRWEGFGSLLVAFARGGGKRRLIGLSRTLSRISQDVRTQDWGTRAILLFTDTWDPAGFVEDNWPEIEHFCKRGGIFVPVLVGDPPVRTSAIRIHFDED
jgi:hypothetical protein